MEVNIKYLTDLAKLEGKSLVKMSFPSMGLMHTFMDNLIDNFYTEEVPADTKLNLDVYVPKENE
jgi:hypothetical protein